jgi:hypothetical protein
LKLIKVTRKDPKLPIRQVVVLLQISIPNQMLEPCRTSLCKQRRNLSRPELKVSQGKS